MIFVDESSGFLQAINDRQIGKALQCLHRQPEGAWTLPTLADEVGMSRAGLTRRFKDLPGDPMFEYLTQLRIQRARELLSQTRLAPHEVSSLVGYESDVAFAKGFKKRTGMTPNAFRRNATGQAG